MSFVLLVCLIVAHASPKAGYTQMSVIAPRIKATAPISSRRRDFLRWMSAFKTSAEV